MTPATRPTLIGTMMRGTQASYRRHHSRARVSSGDTQAFNSENLPGHHSRARASSGPNLRTNCPQVWAPFPRAREQRRETIRDLWLACYTQQEIADAVGVSQAEIAADAGELSELAALPKLIKLAALHEDAASSRRPQEQRRRTRWAVA